MPLHTDTIHHALLVEAKASHPQKASNRILLDFVQLTVSSLDHTIATDTEKLDVFIKRRDCKMLLRSVTRRIKMPEESVFLQHELLHCCKRARILAKNDEEKYKDQGHEVCNMHATPPYGLDRQLRRPESNVRRTSPGCSLGVWVFRRRIYE
jgi:hypothetical protein